MQRFSVIGTAHVEHPGLFAALEEALDRAAPDQLILEMPDDVVARGDVANQKPEMLFAYRWAARRKVPVRGHEPSAPSILRRELTPQQVAPLVEEMDALVSDLSLARSMDIFCKRAGPETLAEHRLNAVIEELIDPEKARLRTQAMVDGVRQVSASQGAIMILCGGAHAAQMAAALPGCQIIHGEHFF